MGAYAVNYIQQKHTNKWDIKLAVEYACKASARTIEHQGCLDPIPWADKVDVPRYPKDANKLQEET